MYTYYGVAHHPDGVSVDIYEEERYYVPMRTHNLRRIVTAARKQLAGGWRVTIYGVKHDGDSGWFEPVIVKEWTINPAAVALGRLGGSARSEAKTAAVRENARKGGWPKGRPRKTQPE